MINSNFVFVTICKKDNIERCKFVQNKNPYSCFDQNKVIFVILLKKAI